MSHTPAELLQQYLAGEADLADAQLIEAHLPHCPLCSDRLAAIAADDAHLSQMLALDEAEQAWIASLDLTGPVLRQVAPWFDRWQWLTVAGFSLVACGLLSVKTLGLISSLFGWQGRLGLTMNVAETLIPTLWRLRVYLIRGGLLAPLLPALLLGGILWLWHRHYKEEKDYA